MSGEFIAVTHYFPGRVRLWVRGLKRNGVLLNKLSNFFSKIKGIVSYQVSPVTGRVLIIYNHHEIKISEITEVLGIFIFTGGTLPDYHRQMVEAVACKEQEALEPFHTKKQMEWPQLSREQALQIMGVTEDYGLSGEEALVRLSYFGPNKLKEEKKRTFWSRILDQFRDFLVQALMGSTAICLMMGEVVDALAILSVLAINAVIGASLHRARTAS